MLPKHGPRLSLLNIFLGIKKEVCFPQLSKLPQRIQITKPVRKKIKKTEEEAANYPNVKFRKKESERKRIWR